MANISKQELIGRVIRRLPGGTAAVKAIGGYSVIESWFSAAVETLGDQLGDTPLRWYLQKQFPSVALITGIADLSTVTDLVLESLPNAARIMHVSNPEPLQYVPFEQDLLARSSPDYILYTISENKLKTRNTDGSLTSLTGTLALTGAQFVPNIAFLNANTTLAPRLNDELETAILAIAMQRLGAPAQAAPTNG